MANESNAAMHPFWRGLFSAEFYKRSQGRIARQVTFFVLVLVVGLGAYRLLDSLTNMNSLEVTETFRLAPGYPIALVVFAVGSWLSFRLVNMPRFADFLIAVEAEMNKVSWPSRTELIRSSVVVIITILGLVASLYMFDVIWQVLLKKLFGVP